jgi:hypothetical protein
MWVPPQGVGPLGAREGHPILGSWIVDGTPAVAEDAPDLFSYGIEGSLRGAGPNGPSVGAWQPTGERSADVIAHYFIDSPEGDFLGLATIRGSVEVSEDGQTFSGTYTFEPPAVFAVAMGIPEGELGPSEVTGQRIAVEPMGEPVAPLPEFPEPEQPSDGVPAPVASPIVLEVSPPAGSLPLPEVSPQESPAA